MRYCLNLLVYRNHRGAHCAPAIFITECTINHICRAGCPHPAAERHHKIVPPAHVTARPTGRCKHRPLQISFSVRGKILPFFPFHTFFSSSSYKKRGCCTRKKSKCSSLFTVKCLQKHKNARHRPPNFQKADNSNRPFWITIVFQRSLFSKFSEIRNSGML